MLDTAHGGTIGRLRRSLRTLGIDADVVCARVGLGPLELQETRIPRASLLAAKAEAARVSKDPHLGYRLGMLVSLDDLDVFGAAIAHSKTLGEAIRLGVQYISVWEQGVRCSLEHDRDRVLVVYENSPSTDALEVEIDSQESIVFMGRAMLELCPALRFPIELHCTGAPPSPPVRFANGANGRLLPRFFQSRWCVSVAAEDLDTPLPSKHPAVAPLLLSRLAESQAALQTARSLPERLELEVRRSLSKRWDQGTVALALGRSPRALQRELQSHGTSYTEVVVRVRLCCAAEMLRMPGIPMKQIAERLGFASVASFSRFFREHTGESPSAFRSRRDT